MSKFVLEIEIKDNVMHTAGHLSHALAYLAGKISEDEDDSLRELRWDDPKCDRTVYDINGNAAGFCRIEK